MDIRAISFDSIFYGGKLHLSKGKYLKLRKIKLYWFLFVKHFQESLEFGYNCARGKCDLVETGVGSNLGWVGRQV